MIPWLHKPCVMLPVGGRATINIQPAIKAKKVHDNIHMIQNCHNECPLFTFKNNQALYVEWLHTCSHTIDIDVPSLYIGKYAEIVK